MPQSLATVHLQIVYSTKHRQPMLPDDDLRDRLHAYLGAIRSDRKSPPVRAGGVADHVHIACRLGRTTAIADLVRDLKRASSMWLKEQGIAEFDWRDGYGAFAVSPSHVAALAKYVESQAEHHRKETFQDEYRRLFALNAVGAIVTSNT